MPDTRRFRILVLYDTIIFLASAAFGISGTSVKALQTYYNINDVQYTALYYAPYVDFVLSAPLWMYLHDRYRLRRTVIGCTIAMSIGFGVQCFYSYSFWFVVVGGMLADTGRVLTLIFGGILTSRWFPPSEKSIASGSIFFASNVGGLAMFFVSQFAVETENDFRVRYLYINIALAGACICLTLCLTGCFPSQPNRRHRMPRLYAAKSTNWLRPMFNRQCVNYPSLVTHIIVYVAVAAVTWSVGNLMYVYMDELKFSEDRIFWTGLGSMLVAALTPLSIGYWMDTMKSYRGITLFMMLFITASYAVWGTTAIQIWNNQTAFTVSMIVMNFAMGATSLMFTETVMELAYPKGDHYTNVFLFWISQFPSAAATIFSAYIRTISLETFLGMYIAATIVLLIASAIWKVRYHRFKPLHRHHLKSLESPSSVQYS